MTLVIEGAHVVTVTGVEYPGGHVVVEGDRILAVGAGAAPRIDGASVVDGAGCLLTPGFVNTHQHLYQWVTRGLAVDATLFEWLTTLYPVWVGIDEHAVHVAATGALAQLALTGTTTSSDHHYVFPRGGGDLFAAEIEAARAVGLRFHPCRGSMDLGVSAGGLPPDEAVEDRDAVLAASEEAIDRWHDPSPGSMLRVALAPCSPFSVTAALMQESAALARRRGVRLHTHLAETLDEDAFCRERFGATPLQYVEELGRADELGSIEPGKLADLALWRIDGMAHAGVADPVAALVMGTAPPLELLLVGGRAIIERDRVLTVDTDAVARSAVPVQRALLERASRPPGSPR